MILKLMDFGNMHFTHPETYFIDGFDNARIIDTNLAKGKESFSSCSVSYYTSEGTEICKQIMLFKKDELIRVLYIDLRYSIFLMSNEGKTIERIN